MYSKILVPVDLAHTEKMSKTLDTAVYIAKHYNATLSYITVTNTAPSAAAHDPKELAEKLNTFAREHGKLHGIDTDSKVISTSDTAVELENRLLEAIKDTGADLVIMGSHSPGIGDKLHFLHSNGATTLEASAAGLGGCPFAPGATGNTATEDLIYALQGGHIETDVNLPLLLVATDAIAALPGGQTASHLRNVPRERVR